MTPKERQQHAEVLGQVGRALEIGHTTPFASRAEVLAALAAGAEALTATPKPPSAPAMAKRFFKRWCQGTPPPDPDEFLEALTRLLVRAGAKHA